MNNLTPHLNATMQRLQASYKATQTAQIECTTCHANFSGMHDKEDTCPDCIQDLLKTIPF